MGGIQWHNITVVYSGNIKEGGTSQGEVSLGSLCKSTLASVKLPAFKEMLCYNVCLLDYFLVGLCKFV